MPNTVCQQMILLYNQDLSISRCTVHQLCSRSPEAMPLISVQVSVETALCIVYQPQAIFRVRPVSRCTASMPGHAEAVLAVSFSPDGRHLASGSGDTTVRFWDLNTQLPEHMCQVSWAAGILLCMLCMLCMLCHCEAVCMGCLLPAIAGTLGRLLKLVHQGCSPPLTMLPMVCHWLVLAGICICELDLHTQQPACYLSTSMTVRLLCDSEWKAWMMTTLHAWSCIKSSVSEDGSG